MAAMNQLAICDHLYEVLEPLWIEICFMLCFPLGWHLFRKLTADTGQQRKRKFHTMCDGRTRKVVEGDVEVGHLEKAVKAWREVQKTRPTHRDTLRHVVRAMAAISPSTLKEEIVQHLKRHQVEMCDTRSAAVIVEALSQSGKPELMDEMHGVLHGELGIPTSTQVYEALLAGHAAAGNTSRVQELMSELQESQKLTARGHALVTKGYLSCNLLDAGLEQMQAMFDQGLYAPPFVVAKLFRVAVDTGRAAEVFRAVHTRATIPSECWAVLLQDCAKRGELEFARQLEGLMRGSHGGKLPPTAYEPLLKVRVAAGESSASELFEEAQSGGARLTTGFLVALIVLCAEHKLVSFAEEVARYARTLESTIHIYSALMKVYASSGLHARCFDLHDEMSEQGLVPDKVMYGCLIKFAVQAGRMELAQELFAAAPDLEVQNVLALIQGAGKDKDPDRVFAIFEKLKSSGAALDVEVFNCVLDAIVCSGDLERARGLFEDMKSAGNVDVISYNTMLKGVCAHGDAKSAQMYFAEISQKGMQPDLVSYHCMISVALNAGSFPRAWEFIGTMEELGLSPSQYTISMMLKAAKCQRGRQDLTRVLALLDRAEKANGIDEVMLSIAIEACIQHHDIRHLQGLISIWERSFTGPPGMHVYAALIKAHSLMQQLDRCWQMWRQMTEEFHLKPNEVVLGCMLDALVSNGQVSHAVALFREWKTEVGTNIILYSTLIKGFAAEGRGEEAMDMWHEIQADGGKMNTVIYNTLIDVQARRGAVEQLEALIAGMRAAGVPMDAITYCTALKGYCIRGDLDQAVEIFAGMRSKGFGSDSVGFNTLLDGCLRHGRLDLFDSVFGQMEVIGVPPTNSTLGVLIKFHGRRRQLHKAFEAVRELPKRHGFAVTAQTRTCLLSQCVRLGDSDRAAEVFEELKAMEPGRVDAFAYGLMLTVYLDSGCEVDAARLVDEAYGLHPGARRMLRQGQDLKVEKLEQLLRALRRKGLQDSLAAPLVRGLLSAKVALPSKLLNTMM